MPYAYFSFDTWQEYMDMAAVLCRLTGHEELLDVQRGQVQQPIEAILARVRGDARYGQRTTLLLRAYSTGVRAKGDDNLAGVILRDLGADNLVTRYESLLEDVSLEAIIAADPDYIFLTIMGTSDEKALSYMASHFESNPAWNGLTAVKEGRYMLLPKDLFHYKPNARWGESYAYLAEILYPELNDENE